MEYVSTRAIAPGSDEIERLLELDSFEQRESVLLEGSTGLGKTMVAQNLVNAALANTLS